MSPSRKHSHLDYGVPEGDFLQVGECNLDDALRKLGGVKLCVCVDQPESGSGFRDLLYATCPGAEVSLVSIKGHGHLEVPVGASLLTLPLSLSRSSLLPPPADASSSPAPPSSDQATSSAARS